MNLNIFAENNFQEHRCSEVLERMRLCCLKWHKESLCCSGINLEKSYLQNPEVEVNPNISRRYDTRILSYSRQSNVIKCFLVVANNANTNPRT